MKHRLTFPLVAFVTLVSQLTLAVAPSAITDDVPAGRVIERVVCKNNPDQSYALYVPSNYSPTRKWALLAAFDPAARGNIPVERFKEAAERYGYILCGSNNSRNGPLQPSADSAKAMIGDVAARFAIDEKRIYLTGFSGGARAATALAVWLKDNVAGVIGCGSGFASGIEPSPSLPFVYYGIVGNEDFNYAEMRQLDRKLQSAGVTYRVEVFEGGHHWAPADVCGRAVEWLELHAIRTGRRSRDDSFVDRLFRSAQDTASSHESAGRSLETYRAYLGIVADFKGLRDIADSEKKVVLLKDSKAVKQALKKAQDEEDQEISRGNELFTLRARLIAPASATQRRSEQTSGLTSDSEARQSVFSDLKDKLSELKRKSDAKENTPERASARRVLNQYTAASFEQSMMLIQAKRYDLAASTLAVDSESMPDDWRLLYNLACAYSLNGEKRRAIEALGRAVQKGFSSAAELERNGQLDSIREEPRFKALVEGLKQKR
jgi:predicted esterase